MAKDVIKGTCGHTFIKYLSGNSSKRASYVRWAEDNLLCPECFQAKVDQDRQDKTLAAKTEAKEKGLPDLEGTEKQVAWALVIRETKIKRIEELVGLIAKGNFYQNTERCSIPELLVTCKECYKNYTEIKTTAKWFIDYRAQLDIENIFKMTEKRISENIGRAILTNDADTLLGEF